VIYQTGATLFEGLKVSHDQFAKTCDVYRTCADICWRGRLTKLCAGSSLLPIDRRLQQRCYLSARLHALTLALLQRCTAHTDDVDRLIKCGPNREDEPGAWKKRRVTI
jgi:hypothetical protein